jgi:hypothetical protein
VARVAPFSSLVCASFHSLAIYASWSPDFLLPIFVDMNRCSFALLSGSMLLSHPILALFFALPRAFPLKFTLYEQNSTRFALRRSV